VKFEEVSATSLAVKRQYVAGRSFANGLLWDDGLMVDQAFPHC
jgi:hypothetical protein